ncbi:hypothetical protein DRE_00872 [Drechslerella stenobrocha 248]|uniref:Uncharacterized protein n=1 Tax=Drechslerella stenobrocha 248 TaxID=1043628 RepID=W7HZZ6_9PEZI|nr:hypothetical protein DRE_00872 [Drechslerella stenobrocha 248]
MKAISLFAVSAIAAVAPAAALPLEGEGGLVIQGGNGNTRLGMLYKPIPSVLEKDVSSSATDDADCAKMKDPPHSAPDIIIAEQLPAAPIREETIAILETMPTNPELILPGLLNLLTPQRISPPSPMEQAVKAAEEMMDVLTHTGMPNGLQVDMQMEIDYPTHVTSSELPDFSAMIESATPRMSAGDTMLIKIVP